MITQQAVLTAMLDHSTMGTCGSSLSYDPAGQKAGDLEETFRFTLNDHGVRDSIQETIPTKDGFVCQWRPVRPIPEDDDFFENVWRAFRETGNFD